MADVNQIKSPTPVIGISELVLFPITTDTRTELITDDANIIDMRMKIASRAYTPQSAEGKFYYSNTLAVNPKSNKGGSLTLIVSDVTTAEREKIFSLSKNTDGVTFGTGNDVPGEFVVAYKIKKTSDTHELQKYAKVVFSVPSESAATEGENIEAQNCELVGTISPLNYEVELADNTKKTGAFQFFVDSNDTKYADMEKDWFAKGTAGIVKPIII